jgi:hypothetical protein
MSHIYRRYKHRFQSRRPDSYPYLSPQECSFASIPLPTPTSASHLVAPLSNTSLIDSFMGSHATTKDVGPPPPELSTRMPIPAAVSENSDLQTNERLLVDLIPVVYQVRAGPPSLSRQERMLDRGGM